MLCDICNKNDALIHRITVINGKRTEQHLCAECARAQGVNVFKLPTLSDLLAAYAKPVTDAVCECASDMDDFKRTGLLGCEECYTTFRDDLIPIIKRAQGGRTEHRGRVPGRSGVNKLMEIKDLRNELAEAVGKEEYERAAVLRDRIPAITEGGAANE